MKLTQALVLTIVVAGCNNQSVQQGQHKSASVGLHRVLVAENDNSIDSGFARGSSRNDADSAIDKESLNFISHHFSYHSKPFILIEHNIADTLVMESDYNYPEAVGPPLETQWINQQIKRLMGFNPRLSFTEGQKNSSEDFLPEHPKYLQEKDTAAEVSTTFIDQRQITVKILDHNYIEFYIETAAFQGGPHIDYEKKYVVFDLTLRKRLKWQDVTTMPEDKLSALIEEHFRTDYQLDPNADLTAYIPVHHLLPTTNFSLDKMGMHFLYNFYPSPGTNFPEVLIPYSDLKGTLNPALEKLMN